SEPLHRDVSPRTACRVRGPVHLGCGVFYDGCPNRINGKSSPSGCPVIRANYDRTDYLGSTHEGSPTGGGTPGGGVPDEAEAPPRSSPVFRTAGHHVGGVSGRMS